MLYAMKNSMEWVADIWCWIYIASQNIWIVALIYIAYKYGHIKL